MANQIQATVYQIDGSPLNNSIQIAFLTSNVYMREFQTDLIPEVNSAIVYYPNTNNQLQEQTFLVSETISALVSSANTGGTTQISTTVLEINQEPQIPSGLTFSFPVQGISIWPVSEPIVGGVNSYLEFKNKKYYLLEDEDTLVTDANTGGGGTSTGVNGLNGTTNIGLGGTLANNTTIDGNSKTFSLQETSIFITGSSDINSQSYLQHTPNTTTIFTEDKTTGDSCQLDVQFDLINTVYNGGSYFGLSLNQTTGKFVLGDYNNERNFNSFVVNDNENKFYFTTSIDDGGIDLLYASNNTDTNERFIKLGDFNGYVHNTHLVIDDENYQMYSAGNNGTGIGFEFDFLNSIFLFGDNDAKISCTPNNSTIEFLTANIKFTNVNTSSTGGVVIPQEFLNIVVNGQNRKLQLFA